MRFEPIEGFEVEDINTPLYADATVALLPQGAIRQYLYILTPSSPTTMREKVGGSSEALGRLNIIWNGENGEPAALMTSLLGRKIPTFDSAQLGIVDVIEGLNIRLSVVDVTATIELEEIFIVRGKLSVRSSLKRVRLAIEQYEPENSRASGIVRVGASLKFLDDIAPTEEGGKEITFELKFLALERGLWNVGSVRVLLLSTDKDEGEETQTILDHSTIAQVYIS